MFGTKVTPECRVCRSVDSQYFMGQSLACLIVTHKEELGVTDWEQLNYGLSD